MGLDELNAGTVQLFPNPAREQVYLLLERPDYNWAELLDETGRSVLQQNIYTGRNTLYVQNLAAGVYSLRLSGEAGRFVFRLVIE